jgi:dihydrofolate reductase
LSTISHHTISLDGFVAGPGDSIDWAFAFGEPTSLGEETMRRIGAIVAGRRWYELAKERWNGVDGVYGGQWDGQVFVLTHRKADEGEARITFALGGLEEAVGAANESAGGKDVGIFGGSLTRQCLDAGLLDEIVLHVAPVLLGSGVRLFGESEAERIDLERVSVGEADQLTDLRFRIRR